MEKLAIFGGKPVRDEKIFYGRQCIEEDDCEAVRRVMLSDFITTGPEAKKLEDKLCAYTGAKYAVCICNGTAALHAACHAAGIKPGDEVITTPMTFAASANCALYCGATPVFADIDPETYNISPASILEKITPRTKAVVAVDFTGQAVQLDEIKAICKQHNLTLIEDAAHSIGTLYKGQKIGSIADMTTFSFHPVKTITGGEGGAILTNDKELYERLVLFRTHGITHDAAQMDKEPDGVWYYQMVDLGYNYRLTDFQAALIGNQLGKIDKFIARRKQLVAYYDKLFADMPQLILQKVIPESDTTRHLYIIQLNLEKLNGTRREIFDALSAENVQCNVHYIPTYYFPYYKKLGYEKGLCPNAERLYERVLSIPLYYLMSDADAASVVEAVRKVIDYYKK